MSGDGEENHDKPQHAVDGTFAHHQHNGAYDRYATLLRPKI